MKILIADDEIVSRKKLEKLIRGLGHEPMVAQNGIEGWQIWKSHRPRVVITDWVMPELDGPGLCQRIRAAEGSQYTYLIMVTTKNHSSDIVTGMDAGADDFITKPFVREELAVRIRAGERIVGFESRNLVIFSLAKLAESRDPETGNHLERIRHYSRTLAETLAGSATPPGSWPWRMSMTPWSAGGYTRMLLATIWPGALLSRTAPMVRLRRR